MSTTFEATVHIHVSYHLDSGAVLAWSTRGDASGGEEHLGERHTNGQGLVLAVVALAREWAELTLSDQPSLPFD